MSNFLAGVAQVDITPPLGTLINGDFITHYAVKIADPLFAKAVVLKSGETTIAICVVDICAMKRAFLDEVKIAVEKATGIPTSHQLISSTHTHAGGSIESLLLGNADLPYRMQLAEQIPQAIINAFQNLQPATIGFGSFACPEYVLCRRYWMNEGYIPMNPVTGQPDQLKTNPFGAEEYISRAVTTPDPEVCYIAIKNLKGEWLSILANYSLHYVGDWDNGTISADYFGAFARLLKNKIGADDNFVGIMSNGTSGEVNIWDFQNANRFPKEHHQKSELIAGDLVTKLTNSIDQIEWEENPVITSAFKNMSIGVRRPEASAVAAARKVIETTQFEKIEGLSFDTMQRVYARETVLLNEYPDSIEFPVQAIKIGSITIGALGGEFFSETGLALKEKSRKYFTITIANDYVGYVCPAHELERGGYETWTCRTSYLEAGAEAIIRNELLSMIQEAADISTLSNLR